MATATGPALDAHSSAAAYPAVTRLDSLDLLRGLCALAVATYHYRSWDEFSTPTPFDGFLAVCGTYGVSVFFVLSGFSLAYAYGDRFNDAIPATTLLRYGRLRAGRLIPLFSVITLASVAGKLLSGKELPDIYTIAANLTLTFGFVDPARTPVIGGWSIGVEVVFYVIFPLLLLARRHALFVTAIAVFLAAWIDRDLSRSTSLEQGWSLYVNPANQLIFFATGTYAGLHAGSISTRLVWLRGIRNALAVVLILAAIFFVSYGQDDLSIVTGGRRLLLTLLALALVIAVAQIHMSGPAAVLSSIMGEASYPLYIIHPLVFSTLARVVPDHLLPGVIIVALAMTVGVMTNILTRFSNVLVGAQP